VNPKTKCGRGGFRKGAGRKRRVSIAERAAAPFDDPVIAPSRVTLGKFLRFRDDRPVPEALSYANDIGSGKIFGGSLAVLAAQRFLRDLDEGPKRGLKFDNAAARRILSWFENFCGLKLISWQFFVLAQIFGWKRADGSRRFRNAWIETGRKNGKSAMLAGIGNYMLVADGEKHAQIYSLATKREQSKIIWSDAVRMRNENSELTKYVDRFASELSIEKTGGYFRPLASEAKSLDGLRASAVLADEIHEWPSRDLWDRAETSTLARKQPLMVAVTTAGANRESFAFQKHLYATRVLSGAIADDDTLAYIAAMDEQDDYRDESLWIKANPSLDVIVRRESLRARVAEIENLPSSKNAFLRFCCNQWVSVTADHTLPLTKIAACAGPVGKNPAEALEDFLWSQAGERCFAGFDRGLTGDLSCLVLCWPRAIVGKMAAAAWFFMPENGLAEKERLWNVPLRRWVSEGWIKVFPGDFIGEDVFEAEITAIGKKFSIADIGFDPYFSLELMSRLKAHGVVREATGVPQTEKMLSEPSDKLLKLILEERLVYFYNPVLAWNLANVILVPNPRTSGLRPQKLHREEKIDGVSAIIDALQRAMFSDYAPRASCYDDRGIITL